jgi:Tol biopolymer transport system component
MNRLFLTLALYVFSLVLPRTVFAREEDTHNKIVFLSNAENTKGKFNIFLLDIDSKQSKRITGDDETIDIRANSLPKINHKRISLIFIAFNPMKLMELDLKTNSLKKITNLNYEATDYQISPDGNSILYTEKTGANLQLFEVSIETGTIKNLSDNKYDNFEAKYSPDGLTIVFVCNKDGSNSIATMNADGSNQKIITNYFGDDRYPLFTPDCKKIIFSSSRSAVNDSECDLYLINSDGTEMELLYHSRGFNSRPAVSPDNNFAAFTSNARGQMYKDIYLMNLKTKNTESATSGTNYINDHFVISPDGGIIVYENINPPNSEIMLYDVKTKKNTNLTNNKDWDCSPSF